MVRGNEWGRAAQRIHYTASRNWKLVQTADSLLHGARRMATETEFHAKNSIAGTVGLTLSVVEAIET